jgi:hypothetical protein
LPPDRPRGIGAGLSNSGESEERLMSDAHHRTGTWVSRGLTAVALSCLGAMATLGTGCVHHASSLTVPLELRATQVPNAATSMPRGLNRLYVPAVQDARPQQDRIGENRESSPPTPVYAASSPTVFVRDALVEQLKANAIPVVDSAAAADTIVTITLNRFWAEESPNYDAQVVLAVEVRDKRGAAVWSGTASGTDGTFGRSLSVENYQQVLSNALMNAIAALIAKPQFQQALAPQPEPPRQRPRRSR